MPLRLAIVSAQVRSPHMLASPESRFPIHEDLTRNIYSEAHIPAMGLSDAELICLNYMESVERGEELPDGCDTEAFLRSGLIERVREQWLLTLVGRSQLADLQMRHGALA